MGLQITHAQTKFGLKEVIVIGATIVASFGIIFGLNAQVGAEASTTVVTPTDSKGWYSKDTRGTGGISYAEDATSPYPTGAIRLTTGNNDVDKAQFMKNISVPLSAVSELSYYTKQVSGPAEAAPSYQIEVNLNGADGGFTTLVYEPYWNGSVLPSVWQSWDVDEGKFWSSRTVSPLVFSGAGGPPFYTLSEIKLAYPDAQITAIGVNIGSYNRSYDVLTDGVNFNGTTYDFELIAPKPIKASNKDQCKNGGYMNFQTSYKNQGQCVSSVTSKSN